MRRSRAHDHQHPRSHHRARYRAGTRADHGPRVRYLDDPDLAPRYGSEYARRYSREYAGRYDREYGGRFDREYGGRYHRQDAGPYDRDFADTDQDPIPDPWGGIYPPVPWGGGAVYGLEGGGPSPFELYGLSPYDDVYDTRRRSEAGLRRPPGESPAYGRHADAELRRWAREHGYDAGYAVRPRSAGGRYRWRGSTRRIGRERRPGRAGPRR